MRFLLFLLPSLLAAQTAITPSQMKCPSNLSAGAYIAITVIGPPTSTKCFSLDSIFKLDPSGTLKLQLPNLSTPSFVDQEQPRGTIDGINGAFSLLNAPIFGSVSVFHNGILQCLGTDYTLAGQSLTFLPVSIPQSGDIIRVSYRF